MIGFNAATMAFIPARGGSKGVPRKNIRPLCGKPLAAYSIEAALKARNIELVFVSTEDEEVAETARLHGAWVPFLRPKRLAHDRAVVGEALGHCLDELARRNVRPRHVVTLYPSHPLRTVRLLESMVDRLHKGVGSVMTVRDMNRTRFYLPDGAPLDLDRGGHGEDGESRACFKRPYGLILGQSLAPARGVYAHAIENRASLIDIDEESDFLLAEEVLGRGLFDFEEGYRGCWW